MKTMKELRDEIIKTMEDLKNSTIDLKTASEINNSAGKIINTVRMTAPARAVVTG